MLRPKEEEDLDLDQVVVGHLVADHPVANLRAAGHLVANHQVGVAVEVEAIALQELAFHGGAPLKIKPSVPMEPIQPNV